MALRRKKTTSATTGKNTTKTDAQAGNQDLTTEEDRTDEFGADTQDASATSASSADAQVEDQGLTTEKFGLDDEDDSANLPSVPLSAESMENIKGNEIVVLDARTNKTLQDDESISQSALDAKRIYRQVGDYEIEILGSSDRAIFTITREGDVLLKEEVGPMTIEVIGKRKEISALEAAELQGIGAYHEIVNTVDGLVDISSLVEHPLNPLIYGQDESVEDLVNLLKEEDGQVFKIIVNAQGRILSGNRRFKAALKVNEQFLEKGLPPKFEFLPAEVVRFDSPESELKYMLLQNKSREKSPRQLAAEIQALIALGTSSAVPSERKMSSSQVIEELRTRLGGGGGKAGRSTAFNLQAAYLKIDTYTDEPLKEELRVYAAAMPNKAKDLVHLECPPEVGLNQEAYQAIVLKRLKENPSESVDRAAGAVNRKIIAEKHAAKSNGKGSGDTSSVNAGSADSLTATGSPTEEEKILSAVQTALAAGDKPSDNRRTPKEIIQLAVDVMGRIDLDSFAELADPDAVGACRSYTILDDAFSREHKGFVFSNPPFSRAGESISLMDEQICNGNTKKLFLVLPVSVQSTKPYHRFIKAHNPLVFQPDKRLSFEPGYLLKHVDPSAKADGNREPSVILYFDADQDYQVFYDHAQNLGITMQSYKPFNPVAIAVALSSLIWEKTSPKVVTCNVFGTTVEIEQDVDETYRIKVAGVLLPNPCPTLVMAKALGTLTAVNKLAPELIGF